MQLAVVRRMGLDAERLLKLSSNQSTCASKTKARIDPAEPGLRCAIEAVPSMHPFKPSSSPASCEHSVVIAASMAGRQSG